jgi:hypothetical protein
MANPNLSELSAPSYQRFLVFHHTVAGLLSDSMEFVPTPAVHRVLCADCGGPITTLLIKAVQPSHAHPGDPIVPNSANLCINCLRNTYVSCILFAVSCLNRSFQVLTSPRGSRSKVRAHQVLLSMGSLTVDLSRSLHIVLSKLRALPCTARTMDDCAAGVSTAPCHLPQETQGLEPCAAHGCALYLDGAPLKETEDIVDYPKGGSWTSAG